MIRIAVVAGLLALATGLTVFMLSCILPLQNENREWSLYQWGMRLMLVGFWVLALVGLGIAVRALVP